jgi:hypothetical protein
VPVEFFGSVLQIILTVYLENVSAYAVSWTLFATLHIVALSIPQI